MWALMGVWYEDGDPDTTAGGKCIDKLVAHLCIG